MRRGTGRRLGDLGVGLIAGTMSNVVGAIQWLASGTWAAAAACTVVAAGALMFLVGLRR
jgi:hypothetical protein